MNSKRKTLICHLFFIIRMNLSFSASIFVVFLNNVLVFIVFSFSISSFVFVFVFVFLVIPSSLFLFHSLLLVSLSHIGHLCLPQLYEVQ